jgi:drug/metabolite transporter (DMT)-like permease
MPGSNKPRRWTVLGSGLLCGVLALVVLFTDRHAFFSPRAVIVVAAIGFAAVLLQLRLRNRDLQNAVHPPVIGLNILGIACALVALFSDLLHLRPDLVQLLAFGAVGSFAISSAVILHSFRKARALSK